MNIDLDLQHRPPAPARSDYVIGAVGAGFIMRDVQLVAYRNAGFRVAAIASRTHELAIEVAAIRGIPKAYETVGQLLDDPKIEILDIAIPPDQQPDVIREATWRSRKVKGILAQKPLAVDYATAREIAELCERSGIVLGVNQNMRYDHSIRGLKTLLSRGYLGEPVLATIEMRAVPHWQRWLQSYGRLTLLNMSVHHLDAFRFLFGSPDAVYVSVRKDPRTTFAHDDGICLYILEYDSGFRAAAWDDVWAGPVTQEDNPGPYIKWRVEGTDGVAEGSLGWPAYPNRKPSELRFTTKMQPGVWFTPHWNEVWFPDAFEGPMAELMDAIATGRIPQNSGADNVHTMALVEACYRSVAEHRPVRVQEIESGMPAPVA